MNKINYALWAVSTLIVLSLSVGCKNTSANVTNSENKTEEQPQRGRGGFTLDKSNDTQLQALLAETVDKFIQQEFKDSQTGSSMSYNLFIPEGYDKNKKYPLVLFMADASTVNKDVVAPLIQGYGGVIWASTKNQAKHPCFVLVPQYTKTAVNDNFETSDEVEMTIRLLNSITGQYSIDKDRLYTTGQSMGGMMSMYFNIAHPDLFAASIFVGCQWDTSKMQSFAKDNLFYIVAAGDEKAPKGMAALKTVLEKEGAKMATAEWSAKLPQTEQEAEVQKLLAKGEHINFVTFTLGSVLPESGNGNEHMNSFDYAYKLDGVRNWLFEQKK